MVQNKDVPEDFLFFISFFWCWFVYVREMQDIIGSSFLELAELLDTLARPGQHAQDVEADLQYNVSGLIVPLSFSFSFLSLQAGTSCLQSC